MKSSAFLSLFFLLCQVAVAQPVPFQHRAHGSPVVSSKEDSSSPSSVKPRAETGGQMKHQLLVTLNLGDGGGRQQDGAAETDGAESSILKQQPPSTPVGKDAPVAGYRLTLQHLFDLLIHGTRDGQTPSSQPPSLTADTSIPTTQLLGMTTEDDFSSASPLPSASTRIRSWLKSLIPQDQKCQNDGAVHSPIPSPTLSTTTRQRYGTIVKRSAAALESSAGMPPTRSRFREKMSASAWNVSLDDVFIILDRFALGFVTLGVFVLFLIAVLVVEALEILWRWWTPERFPARGRSRIRLTGAERRLKAWENWERDRLAEESRGWWAPPRKCR